MTVIKSDLSQCWHERK